MLKIGRFGVQKRVKVTPQAYHTPHNRPPEVGLHMPNSKSLTEALVLTLALTLTLGIIE